MTFFFFSNWAFWNIGILAPQKNPHYLMGHFSDPGTRRQPRHQNVCPDEPVVCIQLNEQWQILKKLERSPLSHTQRNRPLNLGPYRLHANKSHTETCGSANQTWTCVISLITITMSKKNLKQTNQKKAFAWCHMMSFDELVIAHDEGKNYAWGRLCGDQDSPLGCLMAVGRKKPVFARKKPVKS